MSVTGRNPTIRLSIIRSQIDKQQQVIALLENRLQESILGGTDTGNVFKDQDLDGILGEVARIYGDQAVTDHATALAVQSNGAALTAANVQYVVSPASGSTPAVLANAFSGNNLVAGAQYTAAEIAAIEGTNTGSSGIQVGDAKPLQVTIGSGTNAVSYAVETGISDDTGLVVPLFQDNTPVIITDTLDTYTGLSGAVHKGAIDFQQFDATGNPLPLEQDAIRQLLYQARALMGELRVEEQHWNTEVQQEKERRKELGDFTKA